jgi:hypothetical protein
MKRFLIYLAIGSFIVSGFSQSPAKKAKQESEPRHGLKMRPVEVEKDYYEVMQRSVNKQKTKSLDVQTRTKAVLKDMKSSSKKIEYQSITNPKRTQKLNENSPTRFKRDNGQLYLASKNRKKLGRVEGFVPKEEMKKNDGHPPVNEEMLKQALGNRKAIEARSTKTK